MLENFFQLTDNEIHKLELFILSPFFTKQRSVVKLFWHLKDIRDKAGPLPTKESISRSVFGKTTISDVNIRKLTSDFTKLLDSFLFQMLIEGREDEVKLMHLRALREKGMLKRFEHSYGELEKKVRRSFTKDGQHYLTVSEMKGEYLKNSPNQDSGYVKALQEKSDNLDYHFVFSKLHAFNQMNTNAVQNPGKNIFKKNFLKPVLEFVEANKDNIYRHHPNIYIIYNVYLMFDTYDDKFLNELVKYLEKNEKKMGRKNLSYYYHYITQYYITKIKKGMAVYNSKVFSIYKLLREKDILVIDKVIMDYEFNNIVNTALILKEYEWLESFIQEYKKYLDVHTAEIAHNLAVAKLSFARKDYENIFSLLNSVDVKDVYYYMNSKILLGRVYIEMKKYDSAKYIVDNLRQYQRTKANLEPERIEGIRNYNKYMLKLLKMNDSTREELKDMKVVFLKELENEKGFVPVKSWFAEKISGS